MTGLYPSLRRWLALLLLLAAATLVRASSIEATAAVINFDEEGGSLAAEFSVNLGPRLEDALLHGVSLSFKLEFILERPRKYWVSEHIASVSRSYRLSYSALTRQYRLGYGGLQQNFATLDEALRSISRVSALPVVERGVLRPATAYDAAVRLSLDRSQLPKPFQLEILTSAEWQVDALTRSWRFTSP